MQTVRRNGEPVSKEESLEVSSLSVEGTHKHCGRPLRTSTTIEIRFIILQREMGDSEEKGSSKS